MTNVNQAPLPRLSKAPLVRASLVKRRYIKYLALPLPLTAILVWDNASIIWQGLYKLLKYINAAQCRNLWLLRCGEAYF